MLRYAVPLLQKYAQLTGINRAGSRSQDKRTKEEGCNTERVYDTELGAVKGNASGGGAGGGAGSGGGLNDWTGLNFGGASAPSDGGIINPLFWFTSDCSSLPRVLSTVVT